MNAREQTEEAIRATEAAIRVVQAATVVVGLVGLGWAVLLVGLLMGRW